MGNDLERNDLLVYLNLLLPKGDKSAAEFNKSLRNFFLYSLLFILLHLFKTTDLEFLGAQFSIPQEWIAAVAPIVLSFLYLRISILYEIQYRYKYEIEKTAREYFGNSQHFEINSAMVSKTVFWYISPSMVKDIDKKGIVYISSYLLIVLSTLLIVFIIPIGITSFFIWALGQTITLPNIIVMTFSIISGLSLLLGFILSIQQLVIEPKQHMKN